VNHRENEGKEGGAKGQGAESETGRQ